MRLNRLRMFSVGDRIRQARKAQKLTQGLLAGEAGISVVTLNRYENGHRTPPIDVLSRMAEILDCDSRWILEGAGENSENLNQESEVVGSLQAERTEGNMQDNELNEIIQILESEPETKKHILKVLTGRKQIMEALKALGITDNQ